MRSCSLGASSGVVTETSSTLVNWCWRIMPRVSRPAAPASARKDGVQAVTRSGSSFSSRIDSRTRLVSGTSAVGISQSAPFGKLMIPIFEIEFGVEIIARVPHREISAVALVEPAALGTTDEIFDELFATHFRLGLDRVSLFAAAALVFQHSVEPCNRLKECRELIVAKLR